MGDELEIGQRPGFQRREVVVAAGDRLEVVEAEWRGALVVVARGEIDLCRAGGERRRFGSGSVLFLAGLGLHTLHNPGVEDAVLVAHSRSPSA